MKSRTEIMCFSYLFISSQIFTSIFAQGLLGRFQDFAAVHTPDNTGTSGLDPAFPPDDTFPSDTSFPLDNTFQTDDTFPQDSQVPADNTLTRDSAPPSQITTQRPIGGFTNPVTNDFISGSNNQAIRAQNPVDVINTANQRTESTTRMSTVQTNPTTMSSNIPTNPTRNTNSFLPNIPFGGRVINLVNGITNSFNPDASWLHWINNQDPSIIASTMAPVRSTIAPHQAGPIVPVVLSPDVPDSGARTNVMNGRPTGRPIVLSITQRPGFTNTVAPAATETTTTTTTATTTTQPPPPTTTVAATTITTTASTTRQDPGGIALGSALNVPVNLRPVASPRSPFGNAWRPIFVTSSVSPVTENVPQQSLGDTRPGLGFGRGSETYRLLTELSLNSFGRNRDLARKLRAMSRSNRRNIHRNNSRRARG